MGLNTQSVTLGIKMTLRRPHPLAVFFLFAIAANVAIFYITRLHPQPAVIAAACGDLLVTIPAAYYFLVVRPGVKPWVTIVPVMLASLLRVSLLLSLRATAGILIEAAIVGWALYRKPRFLMSEFRMLRYGLFSWRDRPDVPEGMRAVPLSADSWIVALLGMLAGVSLLEAGGVHLMVARSHPKAAWALTAVSVYGAVMLVAMARSIVLRPVLVGEGRVVLRYGLLREMVIERGNVVSLRGAALGVRPDVAFTFGEDVAWIVELRIPVGMERLYGGVKMVRTVGVSRGIRAEFRA